MKCDKDFVLLLPGRSGTVQISWIGTESTIGERTLDTELQVCWPDMQVCWPGMPEAHSISHWWDQRHNILITGHPWICSPKWSRGTKKLPRQFSRYYRGTSGSGGRMAFYDGAETFRNVLCLAPMIRKKYVSGEKKKEKERELNIRICTYKCIYVHLHLYIYMWIQIHVHIHTYISIYV